jgi:cell division protein ZapA
MAQVTLRINGYAYTIGCRDGEEQHLQAMAAQVERRIETIRATAGQSGESRMLVMAALLMADDLFEMERRLQAAETAASTGPAAADARLGRRLSRMAKRAEEIAAGLEAS